jgi:hypothetical protein
MYFFHIHLHLHFKQRLTTLDLHYNQIGDAGAQFLTEAIQNNQVTFLQMLCISSYSSSSSFHTDIDNTESFL